MITKQLSSFTIDKEVIKKFDEIVCTNEKSIQVERMIREFLENNPDKVKSLKYKLNDRYPPDKRGCTSADRKAGNFVWSK